MSLKPTQRNSHQGSVAIGFVLSVLLHLPLVLLTGRMPTNVEPLQPSSIQNQNSLALSLVEEIPEEEKKEEDPTGQVVSFERPDVEKTPEKARFIDQYESESDREQVRKALPGTPETPTPKPQPMPTPDSQEVPEERAEESPRSAEDPDLPSPMEKSDGKSEARETAQAAQEQRLNPQALFPQLNDSRIVNPAGQGGSIDYLRDVDEGEKTLLNRKTERYWAFFDRVKLQIAEEYSAHKVYQRRDPTGNIYGVKDRYSTVRVTLNSDGSVRQLHVSRRSGLDFLDDEAVRSVREAAPFHNPPEGLKDQDGLIHFTFGFYLEITNEPNFRIFR